MGTGFSKAGSKVALKIVPKDSAERENVQRLASKGLPLVAVLSVVVDFRVVLGRSMSVIVMSYRTPLMDWLPTASPEVFPLAVASICVVG